MRVFLFTKQMEIGYILAEEIRKLGHSVLIFQQTESMFLAITNQFEQPDLIAADYTIFNHENFNFSQSLEDLNIFTPVIYYNDPCPSRGKRSISWMGTIKEKMSLAYNNSKLVNFYSKNLDDYKNVFELLESLVESEELSKYIPLMQKPIPLPHDLHTTLINRLSRESLDSLIYDFKKRTSLPQNLYNLLLLLNDSKGNPVTAEELSEMYTNRFKHMTPESVKVHISSLRHYIKEDTQCPFYIANFKDGYKLI